MSDDLDPTVWMPRYMFVLQSMAHCYPDHPNDTMRQKVYALIHDLPITMPHSRWQRQFCAIMDECPVNPYLKSRDSFTLWVYFVRNRVYASLGLGQVPMSEHQESFYNTFLPEKLVLSQQWNCNKRTVICSLILLCGVGSFFLGT